MQPRRAESLFVSGPAGTHNHIFVYSNIIYLFLNGASSSARGEVGLSVSRSEQSSDLLLVFASSAVNFTIRF
jgi:hypothetical protein